MEKGIKVKFKPEFADFGDESIVFITITAEEKGRVDVMACINLPINPTETVPVEWLEKA